MGAVGCVLVPLALVPLVLVPLLLPGAVLPVPARSRCMHESRSRPIKFSQRLSPPTVAGGVTGEGETMGPCDGVTAGVCEGVTVGVCEGVIAGVCDGVTARVWEGVVWAKAAPATATSTVVHRVFNMAVPFIRDG
jgi:hypothetical protein